MALTPQQLVEREVIQILTADHKEMLATSYGMEEANDLFSPALDYESALIDEGWIEKEENVWHHPEIATLYGSTAEEACYELGIDPHEREVLEHWIVSPWLADKLEAQGERINKDFHGLCIWGRTTTGQAIYMDECIQSLCS